MALKSATGGNLMFPGAPVIVVPVGRWTGSWRTIVANVTQTDCGGATAGFPTNQNNTWTARLARDDVNFPEAVGLASGTVIPEIHFKLGAANKTDKLVNTVVESVETENDAETGEVVRCTITGRDGFVTHNQNPPA